MFRLRLNHQDSRPSFHFRLNRQNSRPIRLSNSANRQINLQNWITLQMIQHRPWTTAMKTTWMMMKK
jgi:hypothetical protein